MVICDDGALSNKKKIRNNEVLRDDEVMHDNKEIRDDHITRAVEARRNLRGVMRLSGEM